MRRVAFLMVGLLGAGCAPLPPHVAAETPAMVSVCGSARAPFAQYVQLAQASCSAHGLNAELISSQPCTGDPGEMHPGTVAHFRCVAPK